MQVLVDTHAFLWWLAGNRKMSEAAREVIDNPRNSVLVSAASAWEITTKHRLGKLPGAAIVAGDVMAAIDGHGFEPLAITVAHAERAGRLPGPHRDPFDRMLIAQSLAHDLPLVSNESLFDRYGVRRIW
ncbi:MAG: type II toxin-antitoxin system VapC family toxin [Gemmatimonadota bacterium]|nr:type II toxin-antitoxin system VapC family toxin [Gemmatimonadota bacterium]MDE2864668.1 type II toxin-antitoxin system VapC family toxin [Gemmatimonadota bacterium]MYB05447.1 type II toxin-antitoxin system VapC family toxin [Gemmatimonadota bacterium]MYG21666.1 type II toxin-antitoxin system VapC family toxin [Gemmatimonadota bacterium]MYJ37962.1 type II toxin-antitoxin system VapC family toxin [Gemmatimonadota bacterium]